MGLCASEDEDTDKALLYFFMLLYLGGVNELKENVKGLLLHSLFFFSLFLCEKKRTKCWEIISDVITVGNIMVIPFGFDFIIFLHTAFSSS